MHRETNQSVDSKTIDLLLVVGLLVLIIFATAIKNIVVSLPAGGILRYAAFGLMLAAGYFLYTRRIVSYRYVLYVDAGKEHPAGTFVIDRMVADKGREALFLLPENLLGLVAPGEAWSAGTLGEEPRRIRRRKLSIGPRKTAYTLFYQKENKIYALLFHPSKKLVRLLRSALENMARVRT